jgi:ubiquinone/menaquinone biosynthesis C-methylase UbiE
MTFWDFCAPFYDHIEKANTAYKGMVHQVRELTPRSATVFEAAAGTGEISIAIADKAASVLCTDLSSRMLNIARKKAVRQNIGNITFDTRSLFDTGEPDNAYDVVIASQVLHLIDEPEKAAAELRRISRGIVIAPVALLQDLQGFFIRPSMGLFRMIGFAPKREFTAESYREFLIGIGLPPNTYEIINGSMPMAVPVWRKGKE